MWIMCCGRYEVAYFGHNSGCSDRIRLVLGCKAITAAPKLCLPMSLVSQHDSATTIPLWKVVYRPAGLPYVYITADAAILPHALIYASTAPLDDSAGPILNTPATAHFSDCRDITGSFLWLYREFSNNEKSSPLQICICSSSNVRRGVEGLLTWQNLLRPPLFVLNGVSTRA